MAIQERNAAGFHSISWKGVGRLTIEQGDQEAVTVEAPDKVMDDIITEVKDGELTIKQKWDWRWLSVLPGQPIVVHVKAKEVREIVCSGAGSATGLNIKGQDLSVRLSGAGSVSVDVDVSELAASVAGTGSLNVTGRADRQQVEVSGVGNYRGKSLKSREAKVLLSGVGNAEVNVSDRLDACVSGLGGIAYLGNPEIVQRVSGLGKITSVKQ